MNNGAHKERTNARSVNCHQATCTRTDRDMYRICPSKLSRRELENLYFTLLENNVDMKKNLNLQQEKIKTLSAKVQRLSYPRNANGAGKDSPVIRATVSEQNDSIIQLKRANERMAEKIRVLNLRLSSAKQFMGKRKANNLNNSTLSSSNTKSNCTASCANLVTAGPSPAKTNSVGTITDYFAEKYSNSSCDVKCKPTIDEMNGKINNLLEELQTSRLRIEKLEELVMRLQGENQTVRAERGASEHALQQQDTQLVDLKDKLRCAEAKVNDMNMELTIEKKKLAELETELKLAENIRSFMSSSTAKSIDEMEQKKVGGEAIAPTNEAKLICDEVKLASDEVHRAPDKVQFIRNEVINVGSNEANRVPGDVEYNWGDAMVRTEKHTEPDDKILSEKYAAKIDSRLIHYNKVLEAKIIKQGQENLTTNEVHKTDEIKLTKNEENVENESVETVSRNEDIKAPDDFQFIRGDEVKYIWGDYMSGTQEDRVADVNTLKNDDGNVARNEINRALDDKTRSESNVSSNEVKKVPSGINLTKGEENVSRNDNSTAPDDLQFQRGKLRVPDDVEYHCSDLMTGTQKDTVADDKRLNDVSRVPNDVEYKSGDFMAETEVNTVADKTILTNVEASGTRNEQQNSKNEEKSLRDDVKELPGYREQQDLNKNIESEDQTNIKLNQELINKISELVSQLEMLKITAAGETYTVTDKIIKVKPTEFKSHDEVKTKKPDAISSPINKQKRTRKLYNVKTKETDNTSSQAKKVKPMQIKPYVAKPKKADRISYPINKQNPTQYKPYVIIEKPEDISFPTSKKKQKTPQKSYDGKTKETDIDSTPQKSYDGKTKETDIDSSQINKEKPNQYKSYDGKTEATDNISIRIDKDKSMKYKSYDMKAEIGKIFTQENKDSPTINGSNYDESKEDDDIQSQMKKQLADEIFIQENKDSPTIYGSNYVVSKEDDDIESQMKKQLEDKKNIQKNTDSPTKYGSNYVESKEDDDIESQVKKQLADKTNIQKNKDSPTISNYVEFKEDDDIESQVKKQLADKKYIQKNTDSPTIYGSNYVEFKEDDEIESQMKKQLADNKFIQKNKDSPTIYGSNYCESKEDDDIESQMMKYLANKKIIQKNKDSPTVYGSNYFESKEDNDIESHIMKKKLAEYESIDVTTKEPDNILRKISNADVPKYESYDFETKEFDDILTPNDTMECIMEVKSADERNKFKVQEPASTYEGKGISQDTDQKRISYPNIILDEFDSGREQSIEKLSLASTSQYAQESKSKPTNAPLSHDDAPYQIPGPIPVNLNDQKKEVTGDPYFRKSIDDTPEIITDSYRKRPNKISYVEKSKQVGSISESPCKSIIDEKSAKSKDSYGESLRKRSLEEKSEKIRKTFTEPPTRISLQQSSEDNIRPPRDLTARQSLDEKVSGISDTDDGERPVKKSKDPMSTRPSMSLSEKSLDNGTKEISMFDRPSRLSLSPKNASIIKDYARDVLVEAKSRKCKQRFSNPCVTPPPPPEPPGPSRILQPTESILKSKDAATSSPCYREPGGNNSPSPSFKLNIDVGGYAPPTAGGQENTGSEPATLADMKNVEEPFEICCASAMVCTCPRSAPRDVSAFRACTGSTRFRTTRPQDNIRHCACGPKAVYHHICEMGAGPSGQRNSGTSMENQAPRTYSVSEKHSRATSPDHTDHEISSITDWAPVKNEQRSPQNSIDTRARFDSLISDERGTTTGTDGPYDQYTTPSEGEVPGELTSHGEWYPGAGSNQRPQQQNKPDAMEATLRSISEELARCRKLLLSQRNQEKDDTVEHALHRTPASRQLSGTYTPVCVFSLHIGTLVLSDEAVVWSRDKNLVLTWKFYSQSAAMTRVQPGRVAIFDFVTEYDVMFNDDMLNYMKNSEMPIVLSELGKEEKPFAKCWVPLQEMLLHANRRADMSLAMVPCERETFDNVYNRQTFGEEIGVLDIWCSLRLDKSLLSAIHPGMRKPSYDGSEWDMERTRESRVIQQAAEDEPSRESSQSPNFGLDSRLSQQERALLSTTRRRSNSEYPPGINGRNFYEPGQDIPCHASERYAEETQEIQEQRQQPPYNFHRFSSPPQKTQTEQGSRARSGYDRWSAQEDLSGIIMNEVPANIRTDNDMREALQQKVRQESLARWPKMEYDSSLKHSSYASVRSLAARHHLSKLKYPQKLKPDVTTDSFQDILNKDKQYIPNNTDGSDPNFSRSANANKYIGVPGLNKLAEASRKSVKYSNAIPREPPKPNPSGGFPTQQIIEISILWLALNEECEAMANPNIKRLYVAYSFLGRQGAELETPFSLPKPKHYADKCYFNFKKTFYLHEADLPLVGHMATCRSGGDTSKEPQDCIVFTLVSEPPEDPLGLSSCEDVGYAYLYLGDVLAYSGGSNGYTEVVGVHGVRGGVCGVLAVRIDNLEVLRICLTLKP